MQITRVEKGQLSQIGNQANLRLEVAEVPEGYLPLVVMAVLHRTSNLGHAKDSPSDKNLASELFTKIGNLFRKSDPALMIPGIENMAYKNNQKTLSQCRKDLGRGNCVFCPAGRNAPQNCYLLKPIKANTVEGKMAHRFMAKWDA